jgi:hypothetical protein
VIAADAGRAVHGRSFVSGNIAAAWRLAIFDKDRLVHSRNRGLSATVSTADCGNKASFFQSHVSHGIRLEQRLSGASRVSRSALSPLKDRAGITDGCALKTLDKRWSRPGGNCDRKKVCKDLLRFWAVSLAQQIILFPKQSAERQIPDFATTDAVRPASAGIGEICLHTLTAKDRSREEPG